MFDPIEEPLDLVAKFVDTRTESGWVNAAIERANVRISTAFSDLGAERVAIIAAITQQYAVRPERGEHLGAGRAVMRLSFG